MILQNTSQTYLNIEIGKIKNKSVNTIDIWQEQDVVTLACTKQARELIREIEKWIEEYEQ